jgi:hypothetical protein
LTDCGLFPNVAILLWLVLSVTAECVRPFCSREFDTTRRDEYVSVMMEGIMILFALVMFGVAKTPIDDRYTPP